MFIGSVLITVTFDRFVLSAVTAQWYFHRNEPAKPSHDITWKAGLLQASSTSLGTIAFGSLVLTMVQCLQYVTQWIRKVQDDKAFSFGFSYYFCIVL